MSAGFGLARRREAAKLVLNRVRGAVISALAQIAEAENIRPP